ncbi:hypothetical protein BKA69DRAFT_1082404 [Paraphysoderma sedebokerense]|nr:hypothetical protein BKA69DRAFT_1082349 [Paraphysoderma sedebokerense]KAI9140046.1 hypothetical protein BKA69DRAFT_1082404 [Paraphysoderma sedebokerense]
MSAPSDGYFLPSDNNHRFGHSPLLTILVYVGIALFGLTLISVVYIVLNRNYTPIKSKQIGSIVVLWLSGVCWFIGSLVANGVLGYDGILRYCKIWLAWVQIHFGVHFFVLTIWYRMWNLHRLVVQQKLLSGWSYYLPIIIFMLPSTVVVITIQLLPDSDSVLFVPHIEECYFTSVFKYTEFALAIAGFLITLVFVVLLRNLPLKPFNEFKEVRLVFFTGSFVAILQGILSNTNFRLELWGKFLICGSSLFIAIFAYWAIMFRPIYNSIFNREAFLKKFASGLGSAGLANNYNYKMGGDRASVHTNRTSNSGKTTSTLQSPIKIVSSMDEPGDRDSIISAYTKRNTMQSERIPSIYFTHNPLYEAPSTTSPLVSSVFSSRSAGHSHSPDGYFPLFAGENLHESQSRQLPTTTIQMENSIQDRESELRRISALIRETEQEIQRLSPTPTLQRPSQPSFHHQPQPHNHSSHTNTPSITPRQSSLTSRNSSSSNLSLTSSPQRLNHPNNLNSTSSYTSISSPPVSQRTRLSNSTGTISSLSSDLLSMYKELDDIPTFDQPSNAQIPPRTITLNGPAAGNRNHSMKRK